MTPIEREVAVFRCEYPECGSRRLAPESRVPSCGQMFVDYDEQRYPDGSYTQIQTRHFTNHGPMVDSGERQAVNPFQDMVDEQASLRGRRHAERDVSVS